MNEMRRRAFPWAAIGLGLQVFASEVEPGSFANSGIIRYSLLAVGALLPLACIVARSAVLPEVMRRGPLAWLTAFLTWVLLSSVWSVDPGHALQPALWTISVTLCSAWYVSVHGWRSFRRVTAATLTLLLAACFLFQLANAPGERLRGFSYAPTNVGFLAGIATILGASIVRAHGRDRWIGASAIAVGLAAIVASSTRTVAIGLLLVSAVVLMRRLGRSGALPASLVLGFAVAAFIVAATGDLVVVTQTPDGTDFSKTSGGVLVLSHSPGNSEYTTGTGRTEVWAETLPLIRQRPIFGWGTGSPERVYREMAASGRLRWQAFNAHDGALGIALTQGLVGLGLFVAACVAYLRVSRRSRDATRSSLLLLLFVSSIGEALLDTGHVGYILIGACFAAAVNDAAHAGRRDRAPAAGTAAAETVAAGVLIGG